MSSIQTGIKKPWLLNQGFKYLFNSIGILRGVLRTDFYILPNPKSNIRHPTSDIRYQKSFTFHLTFRSTHCFSCQHQVTGGLDQFQVR